MAAPSRPEELHQRLIRFGICVCRSLRQRRRDLVVDHIAKQLLRSVTSPAANYGEARAAESKADFVHKMRICLKELRETNVWLQLIRRLELCKPDELEGITGECEELVAIFTQSVLTATKRARTPSV